MKEDNDGIERKPDWEVIKAGFMAGKTVKELASLFPASEAAIYKRSLRQGWRATKNMVEKLGERTIEPVKENASLKDLGLNAREILATRFMKHLDRIDKTYEMAGELLEPSDFLAMQRAESELCNRMEKVTGLEGEGLEKSQSIVNIGLVSQPLELIEVTPEKIALGSSQSDDKQAIGRAIADSPTE